MYVEDGAEFIIQDIDKVDKNHSWDYWDYVTATNTYMYGNTVKKKHFIAV